MGIIGQDHIGQMTVFKNRILGECSQVLRTNGPLACQPIFFFFIFYAYSTCILQ